CYVHNVQQSTHFTFQIYPHLLCVHPLLLSFFTPKTLTVTTPATGDGSSDDINHRSFPVSQPFSHSPSRYRHLHRDHRSACLSSASKSYKSALQSRSDMFMGFEEIDGDDDTRKEFPCPFCSEYYNILGLCCYIDDEHTVEAKNGVLLSFFLLLMI
ncbi:hypothetical protein HYC85_017457, partial [Camellia sinensis]